MRKLSSLYLFILLASSLSVAPAHAGSAKILKVLPLYMDQENRRALSPSLYERDAYQALLRQHPEKQAALAFDINWRAKAPQSEKLVLRIEVRSASTDLAHPIVIERKVRAPRFFSRWTSLLLEGDQFKEFGKLMAWRVTLLDGDQVLAEEHSFLW